MMGQDRIRRRSLRQLAILLKRIDVSSRRFIITEMPSNSRAALLEFMTKVNGHGQTPMAAPSSASKLKAKRRGKVRKPKRREEGRGSLGGIRSVRPGAFQASICFSRLLVRSRTTRCAAQAAQFKAVLLRMCQLVSSTTGIPIEDRIRSARQTALAETGLGEQELQLSYATVVSSGSVGAIESPTTPSLAQALNWRQRLSAARHGGWPELRGVWLEVLHERSQRRRTAVPAGRAVKRVDSAWQNHAERRLRLSLRREAQQQQKQDRDRQRQERRLAAQTERLKVMVQHWILKLEGALSHTQGNHE